MRAIYNERPANRGRHHPLVRLFDRPKGVLAAPAVALTRPGPSLISRAKSRADPRELRIFMANCGAALEAFRRHGATSGELKREADLSTEQARTQAPSRFPRAHGHQGRTQGGGGTALARTQAAVCLTRRGVRAHRFHGTTEAAGGLSGCGVRDQGLRSGVPVAGAQARGRRAGAFRLYRVEEGRQCRRAQPGSPPLAGNGAACGRQADADRS